MSLYVSSSYESTNTESSIEQTSTSSDEDLDQEENLELTGDILGNYNILVELGRGSFSIVWLVYGIETNKFYALKVQNPSQFKDGYDEIKFVEKLSKDPPIFNNLIDYFIEIKENKKYLCSVWELHCSNLDYLLRKGQFTNGFPLPMVKSIMKQLINAINILHKIHHVFHGDIKTDNILVKGINNKDKYLIEKYKNENFIGKYKQMKNDYWLSKGKSLSTIDKMKKEDKLYIRKKIHSNICEKIFSDPELNNISKYSVDDKYLKDIKISLADFGTYCDQHSYYDESFGTRYYQAPEIILMSKCSLPVDIWALGCTFYELLSGKILFDPIKDHNYSRDYYHLTLINNTCGNFPKHFLKETKFYKNFFDSNYILDDYTEPEENRLDRKINDINLNSDERKQIKELLLEMLTIDPNKRIKIQQLTKHPFFTNNVNSL